MSEATEPGSIHRAFARRERARKAAADFRGASYWFSSILSVAALIASIAASFAAGHFSNTHASNPVADLILSNTRAFEVDAFFVYGTFLFMTFVIALAIAYPRRMPFIFLSLATFFFIRAGFVTLTHIAPFPEQTAIDFGVTIRSYFFGSDLFFSGHTGSPFLMALIFWSDRWLRYAFLATSCFFAAVVLLGHLHYSIDVASAFFITYAIFHICEVVFARERALFFSDGLRHEREV